MPGLTLKSGVAPVHHGELYYEMAGSGRPILFIHAGVADHTMWDGHFELFSKDYQVIRYDTRGFGRSRTDTTEFSNRQDILDLFTHLGVERACVIGISRGGQIAIDFTLENPGRVYALVTVAAGISGYEFQPDESEGARQEYEFFSRMEQLWESKEYDELSRLEVHAWVDGPSQAYGRGPSHLRDYVQRVVLANYTRQDGEATAIPLKPPAANRLGEIHVPTLILVGEYDTQGTLKMADKLQGDIPGARKVIFRDTAHMLPMEQPEKFSQVVLEFLKNEV